MTLLQSHVCMTDICRTSTGLPRKERPYVGCPARVADNPATYHRSSALWGSVGLLHVDVLAEDLHGREGAAAWLMTRGEDEGP